MSGRVLVADSVAPDLELERSLLEPAGLDLVVAPDTEEATLVRLAEEADAILVCYARIGRPVVEAAQAAGARVIARTGIGWDNIDVEAASDAGITVTNVPDYCIGEVADHTMALLLAVSRGVVSGVRSVDSGGWDIPRGQVHRVQGRRLALLGVGRIGREVALRAVAFGIEVTGFDPFATDWSLASLERADTLAGALRNADFVSLHTPLTPETRHLIDAEAIALMRRAPVLVNTARGGLVDLEALGAALDAGTLGGAALDVTDPEPLPADHPLRSHPRALVTPHMAFYSAEAEEELRRRACDEVLRSLAGRPARSPVVVPSSTGAAE